MSNEYAYRASKADDVHSGGITFLQRPDGCWAVPGGGHIVSRRHAVKAADNLFKSNPNVQSLISNLVTKMVQRLEGV
jgi:hypothetical protein